VPLAVSTPVLTVCIVLYVILFISLGIASIRKGHWIMFLLGIPIPVFWLIGALMPPTHPEERMA
jgi:hypothetical protein